MGNEISTLQQLVQNLLDMREHKVKVRMEQATWQRKMAMDIQNISTQANRDQGERTSLKQDMQTIVVVFDSLTQFLMHNGGAPLLPSLRPFNCH